VPQDYLEIPQLGQWVKEQRRQYRNGKLSDERINLLETISFKCVPGTARSDEQWEEKYEELVAFQKVCGHCRVPPVFSSNLQLGI